MNTYHDTPTAAARDACRLHFHALDLYNRAHQHRVYGDDEIATDIERTASRLLMRVRRARRAQP